MLIQPWGLAPRSGTSSATSAWPGRGCGSSWRSAPSANTCASFRRSIEQRIVAAGAGAAERRRPLDDRDARPGAGASGSGARRLRDRRARIARQAQPDHAAAALSRVAEGARARAAIAGAARPTSRPALGAATSGGCSPIPTPRSAPRPSRALARISNEDAASLARPMLADPRPADPRPRRPLRSPTSTQADDLDVAEAALAGAHRRHLAKDARSARRDVAVAIRQIADPRFRRLLIPLLYDPAPDVADEAMASVRAAGADDFVFVPTLDRAAAASPAEGPRARRCSSATASRSSTPSRTSCAIPRKTSGCGGTSPRRWRSFPTQKSVDVLAAALDDRDGFLRYKAVIGARAAAAEQPALTFPREPIEKLTLGEGTPSTSTTCRCTTTSSDQDRLPARLAAGAARSSRRSHAAMDRIYRLLGVDLSAGRTSRAAQWTLAARRSRAARASASEYLDNILERPAAQADHAGARGDAARREGARAATSCSRRGRATSRKRSLQLINDDDQVDRRRGHRRRRAAQGLGARRRHRARAGAPRRARLVRVRGGVVGARREADAGRTAPRALARAAAGRGAGRSRCATLPLFASVSASTSCSASPAPRRQVRHDPGSVLLQEGAVPETIHFLLDGRVIGFEPRRRAAVDWRRRWRWGSPRHCRGRPMRGNAAHRRPAVTLVLTVEELRTLLADNIDLVTGLFTTLSGRAGDAEAAVHPTHAGAEFEELAASGFTPVEKVLALQRVPIFSRGSGRRNAPSRRYRAGRLDEGGEPLFAESRHPPCG